MPELVASSTSAARAERRPFPVCTGVADVVRITPLTPRMARITLGGPALDDFFVEEPGEIVTLLWPAPGEEIVLPELGWRFPPGVADTQHARNYTVRRWDATAGELDVDFVLHGDHGLASRWAERRARRRPRSASPDRACTGPRTAPPTGRCSWPTRPACPRSRRSPRSCRAGTATIALVEVADAAERQTLHVRARLDLRWLHRDGAPAGHHHAARRRRHRARAAARAAGAPGAAGEALAMRDVRRHLRGPREPARRGGRRPRLLEARHDARLGVRQVR